MKAKSTTTITEKDPMLAECSLAYRSKIKPADRPRLTKSNEVAAYLRSIYNPDTIEHHEEFTIVMVNRNSHVLGWVRISSGGLAGTIADPKLIFQAALLANASGIILCHNHPSGNLKPSDTDIRMTRQLREAGKVLDVQVLDHIILTEDNYYSFADEGMI